MIATIYLYGLVSVLQSVLVKISALYLVSKVLPSNMTSSNCLIATHKANNVQSTLDEIWLYGMLMIG